MKISVLVLFFFSLVSVSAFAADRITGDAIGPNGDRYYSVAETGPDGGDVSWRLIQTVIDSISGLATSRVILRPGEKVVSGYPINAWWSVAAGRLFQKTVISHDGGPSLPLVMTAIAMPCAGWGNGKDGSITGLCWFVPDVGEFRMIARSGDIASDPVSGVTVTVGNFRIPVIAEPGFAPQEHMVFAYATCDNRRCIVAVSLENGIRVVFVDGYQGWVIKTVRIGNEDVEEFLRSSGNAVHFTVSRAGDGNYHPAIATALPDGRAAAVVLDPFPLR